MELRVKEENEVITIMVKGDIEHYTSEKFKDAIFEICRTAYKNIYIDLSSVDYIDSSGIGVLVSLYKIQNRKGKTIIIRKANEDIHNILKLTTLSDVFEV